MRDSFGRAIDYMRISVTDRCNLRCRYCMPEDVPLVDMADILTYEEIVDVASAAVSVGITRFKVTGGEPLARRGCTDLIRMLKGLPGVEQVTLTTNGTLLEQQLPELHSAGIDGINISLDTLDKNRYQEITGQDQLETVLSALDRCLSLEIPTRVNAVLLKGLNDHDWEPLVLFAKDRPVDVRFIELMPIGFGKNYSPVSNTELLEKIHSKWPGTQKCDYRGNGPAVYYSIPGFLGKVGLVSALHGPFCDTCNRLRLTAQGQLKPCLCYADTLDIRSALRETDPGERDDALKTILETAVLRKPEAHRFGNQNGVSEEHYMNQIGG